MRHYETLFIANPDLNEADLTIIVEKFSKMLSNAGAIITRVDLWGRRRMAYEVKKNNKGYFVLFDYGATPKIVTEMERHLKIDEHIIRYLTVKKFDFYDPASIAKIETARNAVQNNIEDFNDELDNDQYNNIDQEENNN